MKKVAKRRPRVPWAQFRDRIHWLSKTLRREVTPKDVLQDARRPDTPYHTFFEWNDKKAAASFRLHQARQLLGQLKIIYHDELGKEVRVREYVRLVHESPATHELRSGYFPRAKAITNNQLEQQCVERAIAELESWQNRWRGFKRIEAHYGGVQLTLSGLRRLKSRVMKKVH